MYSWGWDWGFWGWGVAITMIFALAIFIIPAFFFLLNLRGALERVSERNRAMPPDYVWLNFIPVFNLGWFIYTVVKVRDSLRREYQSRGWPPEGDFGYSIGLAAGILAISSAVLGWVVGLGSVVGIALLVCWIVYWVKIANIKGRLGPGAAWLGPNANPPYSGSPPAGYSQPGGHPQPGAYPPPSAYSQPGPYSQPEPQSPGASPEAGSSAPGATEEGRQSRLCVVCGTPLAPDDKFCRTCGLRLP